MLHKKRLYFSLLQTEKILSSGTKPRPVPDPSFHSRSLFRAGYVEFGLLAVFAPRLLITADSILVRTVFARFRVELLIAEKDCRPCPLGEDDLVQFLDEDLPGFFV